ncbi:MAG TPA: hypothetical protein DIC18_03305 [Clostridiales bacterium]|nr:hypothetical protein [Clostridiales bacterium]
MISFLRRRKKILMYALLGVAATFSVLKEVMMIVGTFAYTAGLPYGAFLGISLFFMVVSFAALAKLIIFLAFRINGRIFVRNSGLLYPFPIGYRDYESIALAFSFLCFLLSGLLALPSLFLPSFGDITDAIILLVRYSFLAVHVSYLLKNYAHDYDKKAFSFSLSIVPIVIMSFRLIMTVVGVLL